MKPIKLRSGLFLILCLFMVMSGTASADVPQANGGESSRLQYFGYYHMDGYQTPDSKYLPYVGQLGNSNVAIFSSWSRGNTLINHINLAHDNGMKVLLNVYDYFFGWNPGGMGDGSGALHANWSTYYADLKAVLSGSEDKLLGFYFDEPWWCGVSEADFRMVTGKLREDFPNLKVVSISAVADFDLQNTGNAMSSDYIEFVTDVGFDYYADDLGTGNHMQYLELLKQKANRDQDIWLVPRAFSRGDFETPGMLQNHLLYYYTLAVQEPRVTGIVPFTMPSGGDWGTGLYAFMNEADAKYDSYLKNAHIQVGKSVIDPSGADLYVSSLEQVPGANAWSRQGTTLRWTAPKSGKIQISTNGSIGRTNDHQNALSVRVTHGEDRVWPASAEWQPVTAANASGLSLRTELEVTAGDEIRFETAGLDSVPSDTLSWDPVILYKEAGGGPGEGPGEEPIVTVNASFKVGNTDNAQTLAANELLVSTVHVTNNDDTAHTVTAIVGLYDATGTDGALANVSYTTLTLNPGQTGKLSGGFKLPASVAGYTAKVFVVSGDNLLSPGHALSEASVISAP